MEISKKEIKQEIRYEISLELSQRELNILKGIAWLNITIPEKLLYKNGIPIVETYEFLVKLQEAI